MDTFDVWVRKEHLFGESVVGDTLNFINHLLSKTEEAVKQLKRRGEDAIENPGATAKAVATSIPRSMWFMFKKFEGRYGTAQAVGIMAVCVGLHAAVPVLVAVPGSGLIGSAPGLAVAETWHQIRTSNSLLRQGVQGLAHLLHLDAGDKETLTPQRIQELGHEAHEELQAAITQKA